MLDAFTSLYQADPALKAHREWVKANDMGCGEDSFHVFWKMLVQEMPADFRFLEIGVYRGQTTSLIGRLSEIYKKRATVIGVSPFDGRAMVWPFTGDVKPEGECSDEEKACEAWIRWVCETSFLTENKLTVDTRVRFIRGDSTDPGVRATVLADGPYDIAYIDGCHQYEYVQQDLANYMPMVKVGGFLVCDDAAWSLKLPSNFFFGFEGASKAVDEVLPPFAANEAWEHCVSLVHLRLYRRLR
jgi:hypothetical protein